MTAKIRHVVIVYKSNQETPLAFEVIVCDSAEDAILKAEALSKLPGNIGATAYSRSGDIETSVFKDAVILKTFGEVPDDDVS